MTAQQEFATVTVINKSEGAIYVSARQQRFVLEHSKDRCKTERQRDFAGSTSAMSVSEMSVSDRAIRKKSALTITRRTKTNEPGNSTTSFGAVPL